MARNSEGDDGYAKTAGQRLTTMSVIAETDSQTQTLAPATILDMSHATARYPENAMMFAPEYGGDIPEHWKRFFELREELLLDYGYNTARAYWADLQDWFEWAVERDKDVLDLSEKDVKQYCALLRRRKYSESTIRRRNTSHSLLRSAC